MIPTDVQTRLMAQFCYVVTPERINILNIFAEQYNILTFDALTYIKVYDKHDMNIDEFVCNNYSKFQSMGFDQIDCIDFAHHIEDFFTL